MKKNLTTKLYRFVTEGTEDELVDNVPGLKEEDEDTKKDGDLDEEDIVNDGEKKPDVDVQKKAFDASVDKQVTEEDEGEEDKEKVAEDFDADEDDKEKVAEDDESLDDEKPVTEEGDAALDVANNPQDKRGPNAAGAQAVGEEDEDKVGDDKLEEEEDVAGAEDLKKKTDAEIDKIDVKEDVRALISGHKLSKEFQTKIKTIFESSIKKNIRTVVAKLQEQYNENLSKIERKISKSLVRDTDKYMNYVVENWMQENKLAIERGIRTEITEEFISSFKKLCVNHNINLPEGKFEIAEQLAKKLEKTEKHLNDVLNSNIELHKKLNESTREKIVRSVSKNLTDTQAEKLKKLAEGVTFKNSEEFEKSVKLLKESYFPSKVKSGKGEVLVEGGLNRVNGDGTAKTEQDVYAQFLENTVKNSNL